MKKERKTILYSLWQNMQTSCRNLPVDTAKENMSGPALPFYFINSQLYAAR